jgi:hypothetical protein
MPFIRPYVTDKFTAYLGDERCTRLSSALWLIDDYTKKEPIGQIKVRIKEGDIKPFKNLSGYYSFVDLAPGIYKIKIESDLYFPEEREVDTSKVKTLDVRLEFDAAGPASGDTSTKLKDVSKLQVNDIVEFHNPDRVTEYRKISNIEQNNTIIHWNEELKSDFSEKGSSVLGLKNLITEILLKPKPSYPFPGSATLVRGRVLKNSNPVVDAEVRVVENDIVTKTDENGEFVLYFKGIKEKKIEIQIEKDGYPKMEATIQEGKTTISKEI